jgi:hypothetical protein
MRPQLLARLLLVTGGTLPALVTGCGGDSGGDSTAQTTPGNGGSSGSGGSTGSGGSDAGQGGSAAGSGGSDAGAGGSDAGSGGSSAGAGGSVAGSGGSGGAQAGAGGAGQGGGAGSDVCVKADVCINGKITTLCIEPPGDPAPFTDCGNGTCVEGNQVCPGAGGAGGAGAGGEAGAGGSEAGRGGAGAGQGGGGSGGAGGSAGSGGSGGALGVPCVEGGACVEGAWCGDADLWEVFECKGGKYGKTDPSFQGIKVCTEKAANAPCLDAGDIELNTEIQAEYSASCLGVQGAAEPPVQKASNGVERCCYEVFAVCVGRPLFLGAEQRLATLRGGASWG